MARLGSRGGTSSTRAGIVIQEMTTPAVTHVRRWLGVVPMGHGFEAVIFSFAAVIFVFRLFVLVFADSSQRDFNKVEMPISRRPIRA